MPNQPNKFSVNVESILGGHAALKFFPGKDQFESSIGIDVLALASNSAKDGGPSGLLRPTDFGTGSSLTGLQLSGAAMFIKNEPKAGAMYAFGIRGSIYTTVDGASSFAALNDAGAYTSGGLQVAQGQEYYDNYMYFATNTTVVRYGPLDGSPTINSDYWGTTLGKTYLTDSIYPPIGLNTTQPKHMMHRHSDGKLYIADTVGNQGVLHIISTTKTTVEGDTDAGSTYQKISFGYGLWPTAIESYGSSIVIAFYEGYNGMGFGSASGAQGAKRAKVAFWDTNSQNFNSMTWVEFPDFLITTIKNVNGTLYFISGGVQSQGFRVSRYIGGNSFQTMYTNNIAIIPAPGALDGDADALYLATQLTHPTFSSARAALLSIGLGNGPQGYGVYNIASNAAGSTSAGLSLIVAPPVFTSSGMSKSFIMATQNSSSLSTYGFSGTPVFSEQGTLDYSLYTRRWLSQRYKIGRPFKITKIRIPFAQPIAANMTVSPFLLFDNFGTTKALTVINNTSYSGLTSVVLRPENAVGKYNFNLELQWSGSALCVVALPIIIEGEYLDID